MLTLEYASKGNLFYLIRKEKLAAAALAAAALAETERQKELIRQLSEQLKES